MRPRCAGMVRACRDSVTSIVVAYAPIPKPLFVSFLAIWVTSRHDYVLGMMHQSGVFVVFR